MSINRWAKRRDQSEPDIIEAIEKAGWTVWSLDYPVDLLTWKEGRGFRFLEVKTPRGKKNPKAVIDKRQREQIEFIELTGTPRITSPEQALEYLES